MKCRTVITTIQEMRWIGEECKRPVSCNIYYFNCHVDKHEFGCGFVVKKSLHHLAFGFTPVNKRLTTTQQSASGHYFKTSV